MHRLPVALLILRLSVFLVMLVWTVDKFLRPDHAAGIFRHFYAIPNISRLGTFAVAAIEMVILLAFVLGIAKRLSYGLVWLLHSISTFASFRQYAHPYQGSNLLFFAAWPMWAACLALYLLRDSDSLGTIRSQRR